MPGSQSSAGLELTSNISSLGQESKTVPRVSTVVNGNTSSGNSVMICGSVAGKIIYCENYIIRCGGCPTSNISTTSWKTPPKASDAVPQTMVVESGQQLLRGLQNSCDMKYADRTTAKSELCAVKQLPSTPRTRYVNFYSGPDARPKKVYAICRPDVKENWISLRVLTRLSLKPLQSKSPKEALFNGETIRSSGQYVEFDCAEKQSHQVSRCRFYVAKHPDFDMLFGSEFAPAASI